MTEFVDVSVVMPAYNVAGTVQRALGSVAAQGVKPREVLVVDDGSTDETTERIREMASRMNGIRLRLFRQRNLGAGAARNRALLAAQGEWIAFLDADDAWLADKMARSIDFARGQELTMIAHNLFGVTAQAEHLIDSHARWLKCRDDPFEGLFLRGFISSSTVMVRRQAIIAAGGFDPSLLSAQDYEMWLAILADRRNQFAMFDSPLLRYTITEQGITGQVDRKVEYSMAILRRHAGNLNAGRRVGLAMFRAGIVHYEAARAHYGRRRYGAALCAILRLPWQMIGVLASLGRVAKRPDFLSRSPLGEEVAL